MTDHTLKCFLFSLVSLGLVLGSPHCLGQTRTWVLKGMRAPSAQTSPGNAAVGASPLGSTTYTFSYVDYPKSPYTAPVGINFGATTSQTLIVGEHGPSVPFPAPGLLLHVETKKATTTYAYQSISFPGFQNEGTTSVNDSGTVIGNYIDSSGNIHGYEFAGGIFTKIDVPFAGAVYTAANRINNAGNIVGSWDDSGPVQHGFQMIGSVFTSFDYPGAQLTAGFAMNNNGDITGVYCDTPLCDTAGTIHGYLLSGGIFTPLDVPGATATVAQGINDAGDIVGYYCATTECVSDTNGAEGFVLSGGIYTTLNVPGASATIPGDINNKGVIVGSYSDSRGGDTGFAHGFIAYP